MLKATLFLLPLLILASCDDYAETADSKQAAATEKLVGEANRQVGMPAITKFTERKFLKMIYELRDTEVSTFTYIVDMNGKRHFLCESVGYGIPYSTQYTNPEHIVTSHRSTTVGYHTTSMPQPDPNGMFMPTSSSATWILAATEAGIQVMYVESEILVSPFRLEE
tara:strand:- start:20351 stop:20848 length:498 start_codon:yes stop_codon:yes gene_type:complete